MWCNLNENNLRLQIRKELKKLNENPSAAYLVSQGFNDSANVQVVLNMIGAALAGGAFIAVWNWLRPHIETALKKSNNNIQGQK